jgi:hypothetical protein
MSKSEDEKNQKPRLYLIVSRHMMLSLVFPDHEDGALAFPYHTLGSSRNDRANLPTLGRRHASRLFPAGQPLD